MGKMKQIATDAAANTSPTIDPAVIVFGRDGQQKAHASWFSTGDADLAVKAAGFMRMKVLRVTTDEHRVAASALAAGRIFESGRGFVPFAKEAAYTGLCAFDGAFEPPVPIEPEPAIVPTVVNTPRHHDEIVVGSLVLAAEGADEPWYRGIVVEARGEGLFVVGWHDWPTEPHFVRRGEDLALLPPSFTTADMPAGESGEVAPGVA